MIIFLLALIGTLIVMAVLTVGRLWFGRRETSDKSKRLGWFLRYSLFNYLFCLFFLYFFQPALTGPFWGWQWVLWPLFFSSIGNLFAYARPAVSVLEEAAAASQGIRSSRSSSGNAANVSRGAIAAGIFGIVIIAVLGIGAALLITIFNPLPV